MCIAEGKKAPNESIDVSNANSWNFTRCAFSSQNTKYYINDKAENSSNSANIKAIYEFKSNSSTNLFITNMINTSNVDSGIFLYRINLYTEYLTWSYPTKNM